MFDILSVCSEMVRGASDPLLALLHQCLERPWSGFSVFATFPDTLYEEQKREAAYSQWERAGSPWRSEQADRDTEFQAAAERLRTQPLGLALVHEAGGTDLSILAFIMPATTDCTTSQKIVRSLVSKIAEFARSIGRRRVLCMCVTRSEIRDILLSAGFLDSGLWMERVY